MTPEFYTPEELAGILKVSRQTIYNWIRRGKLKAASMGKHYPVYISSVGLPKFIAEKINESH